MGTTQYTATDPDGGTHRRTSPRTYTHAVLVFKLGWQDDPSAWVNNQDSPSAPKIEGPKTWHCYGFCGRLDLAEKLAAKSRKGRKPGDRVEIVALTSEPR